MNAIQTKLELSANLIIETEFMRRKLFRSSKLTEDPQIFDVEFADSFGLEFILKLVFGSPLLAKVIIKVYYLTLGFQLSLGSKI